MMIQMMIMMMIMMIINIGRYVEEVRKLGCLPNNGLIVYKNTYCVVDMMRSGERLVDEKGIN